MNIIYDCSVTLSDLGQFTVECDDLRLTCIDRSFEDAFTSFFRCLVCDVEEFRLEPYPDRFPDEFSLSFLAIAAYDDWSEIKSLEGAVRYMSEEIEDFDLNNEPLRRAKDLLYAYGMQRVTVDPEVCTIDALPRMMAV